jgi:hypothetical protein
MNGVEATRLLANGVHPKIAGERLGHSKIGITPNLYCHVIPGMQEDAAAIRIGGTENRIEFLWKISQLDWRPRPELNWCKRFCSSG